MKPLVIAIAAVVTITAGLAEVLAAAEWTSDVRQAFKSAARQKRALAIYITNPGCHRCQQMMKNTLGNPYIRHQMKQMVKAKVDYKKQPKIAQMLKISELPSVVVLSSTGKELGRISGVMKVKDFQKKLARIQKKIR